MLAPSQSRAKALWVLAVLATFLLSGSAHAVLHAGHDSWSEDEQLVEIGEEHEACSLCLVGGDVPPRAVEGRPACEGVGTSVDPVLEGPIEHEACGVRGPRGPPARSSSPL